VSEETLRGLYGRADVFMCLSEHEGFGLPVFEAMRCGIPVVAWGSSALSELLRDHPLAIEDFDIPAFASAVSSLRNPAVWKAVLSAQEQILNLYTKDAVLKQLLAAASHNAPPVMGRRRSEHAAKSVRALAAANTSKCRDIFVTEVHGLLRSQPHDFSSNYVSQHDLVALRELLSRLNQARFRLLDTILKSFADSAKHPPPRSQSTPFESSTQSLRLREDVQGQPGLPFGSRTGLAVTWCSVPMPLFQSAGLRRHSPCN
jgi:hypothetical protein